MAGSIKLFQFNKRFCQTIGIFVPQTDYDRSIKTSKNVIFVVCVVQFALASIAFLLYDAKSMGEFGEIFFMVICSIEAMCSYFINVWNFEDILKFIENCEAFIEKSTFEYWYHLMNFISYVCANVCIAGENQTIEYKRMMLIMERVTKGFCFAMLLTTASAGLFPLFYTGISYYILDFGVKSFFLYPPTEFVSRKKIYCEVVNFI